jgi:hypothetical protein
MGTPAYMSPEQVKGLAVDGRADLFSLGVMLYEMATWQSPFERGNFMETLHAVAYDESPPMQSMRAQIPHDLQRIVSRCLRKRVEDRYPNARLLVEDLRQLRRDAESGVAQRITWRQRLLDMWENVRSLPPSRYAWMALGVAGLLLALNYSLDRMGSGGAAFLLIVAFWIYRHVRNRRQRLQAAFVRQISKIPEVRMIVIRDQDITVLVDRPAAQLYNRINSRLRTANRKLYYGEPMTVSIQHAVLPEQTHQLLSGPGVEYVREDAP